MVSGMMFDTESTTCTPAYGHDYGTSSIWYECNNDNNNSKYKTIDNINNRAIFQKNFGAIIHQVYSKYFNEYILTLKYWKPVSCKKLLPQTQKNLRLSIFLSGSPPRNRGRHFDRNIKSC